ncbi:HAD-IA family hydrolase [Candidatus Bipolaricaulota bacterium]|nr:HAD-IA family hydrolase [Candidatus Bipolaricaulota bacterium]
MTEQCVLFDMDGTLYDSGIDFLAIRERLGLPQDGRPILEQLHQCAPLVRSRGISLLHAAEAEGAANGQLIPGTTQLLAWLHERDIRCGLVTNNSRKSVDAVLSCHPLELDLVLTRDDAAAKPAPDLFLLALNRLDCSASDAVAVGDTHLDALAAHSAGIREIYLVALRDWMALLLPADVEYKAATDLAEVRSGIEAWLKC